MLTAIGDVMREAYARNLITTRDGNCSLRVKGRKCLYITPSAVRKITIIPETINKLDIKHGRLYVPKGSKPSGELAMHWALQQQDCTRAVLHLHPTYTIAAMHAGVDLQELAKEFPELGRYTKVAPNVPKVPVTSQALAYATAKNMLDSTGRPCYNIVGQVDHGICAIGKNPWEAFEHCERLEHVAKIAMLSGRYNSNC